MNQLFKMKLHETITPGGGGHLAITRVPGGWIYRFYDQHEIWNNNSQRYEDDYTSSAVFVPYTTIANQPLNTGEKGDHDTVSEIHSLEES
tara:strand:- start:1023 stop:1292 length:270 start_codon:yes stop_codon:yes gene_type:complete